MIDNFPGVQQANSYDCGPAAVKSVFAYYNRDTYSLTRYVDLLNTTSEDGTYPRSIEAVLRRHKFCVIAGEMRIADLRYFTTSLVPVICLVTSDDGFGHYVVVTSVNHGSVHYFDPECGRSKKRKNTVFEEKWQDFDRYGMHYQRIGIVVRGCH